MPDQTQQTVQVNVTAGGDAAQAFKDMGEAAAKLTSKTNDLVKATKDLKKESSGFGQFAGTTARSGLTAGLAGYGPESRGGAIATGIHTLDAVMKSTAGAMTILNDSFLTGAQKQRALVAKYVPLGESLQEVISSAKGVADQLNRQELNNALKKIAIEVDATQRAFTRAAQFERGGYLAQERAIRGNALTAYAPPAREDIGGRIGYEEYNIRIGAEDVRTRARREAQAAASQLASAKAGLGSSDRSVQYREEELKAAKERLKIAKEEESFAGGRAEKDQAIKNVETANLELAKAREQREQDITRYKEAQVKSAQAESTLRKANIGVMQAEAEILARREQRTSSFQRKLGSMNQGELLYSANALKLVQQYGIENAPPELAASAAQLAPELIGRQQEQFGGQRRDQLRGLLGNDLYAQLEKEEGLGDLTATRRQQEKVQAEVRIQVDLDEAKLAQQLAEAVNSVFREMIKQFRVELINKQTERQVQNQAQNAARY